MPRLSVGDSVWWRREAEDGMRRWRGSVRAATLLLCPTVAQPPSGVATLAGEAASLFPGEEGLSARDEYVARFTPGVYYHERRKCGMSPLPFPTQADDKLAYLRHTTLAPVYSVKAATHFIHWYTILIR